jgi:hypothetical protein
MTLIDLLAFRERDYVAYILVRPYCMSRVVRRTDILGGGGYLWVGLRQTVRAGLLLPVVFPCAVVVVALARGL